MTNVVLMRGETDCHYAAIGTACQVDYETAKKAFWPLPQVDPVDSTPPILYLALTRLGFWKRNITLDDLIAQRATPLKTIILIHSLDHPFLAQHYIVLAAYRPDGILAYWGFPFKPGMDARLPVFVSWEGLKKLYLGGWPNCAFEVIRDTWWQRFKRWIRFS